MNYDVVVVGAGRRASPRLSGSSSSSPTSTSACSRRRLPSAAHSLSGCVLEPGPLDALLPGWRDEYQGIKVRGGARRVLAAHADAGRYRLPTPPQMNNHGNFIVSLGNLTRVSRDEGGSAGRATSSPGFAAAAPLYRRRRRGRRRAASATWASRRRRARPELRAGPRDPTPG